MGDGTIDIPPSDRWADQAARTLRLVQLVSTILFCGAGLAVALGLITAITQVVSDFSQVGMAVEQLSSFRISQFTTTLLSCLLPAGVLLAAGGYLRLQALRYETDLVEEDDLVEAGIAD